MTKTARKHLMLDIDAAYHYWVHAPRLVTARLGPNERPLHCPPRTTNKNKPTRFRVYYK